ncbi:MAG: hypothetical protein IKM51_00845, partial [Oscillospiraceae bacterium]|nr:hypothetical protein [Oscillospiraceae bacterium]
PCVRGGRFGSAKSGGVAFFECNRRCNLLPEVIPHFDGAHTRENAVFPYGKPDGFRNNLNRREATQQQLRRSYFTCRRQISLGASRISQRQRRYFTDKKEPLPKQRLFFTHVPLKLKCI